MPTTSKMFETLTTWHQWNGADHRSRELDAQGRHTSAEEYRALRDRHTVDPLDILSTAYDLIQRLTAGRWDAITEARLRGATWDQVAVALNVRADEVRTEYAAMVDWCSEHRPDFVDLPRYRQAL
nr:hypothetical protein [Pseudonocardia sp. AL041005-10]